MAKHHDFETGLSGAVVDGTNVSDANSAGTAGTADAFVGTVGTAGSSSLIYSSTQKRGTLSCRFGTTSGVSAYVRWNGLAQTTEYGRIYLYVNALPTNLSKIVRWGDSASVEMGSLGLSAVGLLRPKDNAGTNQGTSTTLSTGQWYRLDWEIVASATGSITVRVYTGAALESSNSADATIITASPINTVGAGTGTIDAVRYGQTTNVNAGSLSLAYIDDIAAALATWAGPSVVPPPTFSVVPVVSGTPQEGMTLTSTTGTASGTGTGLSYAVRWQRAPVSGGSPGTYVDIAAATGTTYVQTTSDVGSYVRAVSVATDSNGPSADSVAANIGTTKPITRVAGVYTQ